MAESDQPSSNDAVADQVSQTTPPPESKVIVAAPETLTLTQNPTTTIALNGIHASYNSLEISILALCPASSLDNSLLSVG
ncbi:hypothetical protein RJT34_17954 [Clitoria ternatea]|uniref:Uncharacterized protein n=1 Tax=Clitoria ternatea TaxID=43366 RepID=A0AAN9JBE1_CLITE